LLEIVMKDIGMMNLKKRIKKHEGLRLKVYKDSVGVSTIGYGRNLESRGITEEEAEFLFQNDFILAKTNYEKLSRFVKDVCNDARKGVLIEMIFQLGYGGVFNFKRMLAAIEEEEFDTAADEMLDSKWAKQTPQRANFLSRIMRNGY